MLKTALDFCLKWYPLENISFKKRLLFHAGFWSLIFLFFLDASANKDNLAPLWVGIISFCKAILYFYGLCYIIIPWFLDSKKILFGFIALAMVLYTHHLLNYFFYKIAIENNIYKPSTNIFNYATAYVNNGIGDFFNGKNFFFELVSILHATSIPFGVKFGRYIKRYAAQFQKIAEAKAQLEIQFLKAQLNPHFLIDSLKNIYEQSLSKNPLAGNAILLLSNLLKHIIYNGSYDLVALNDEVKFIKDYLDLEKVKRGDTVKINYLQKGDFEGHKIAPLLLVNYIENAFKYGNAAQGNKLIVSVEMKIKDEFLYFSIENDVFQKSQINPNDDVNGSTLHNVKQRLSAIYPDSYNVNEMEHNAKYKVEVDIDLKGVVSDFKIPVEA